MDGLSAVAGVAIAGVQLSKSLYDLYSAVKTSRHEIQDVANNVSLLAMILEELDGVLRDNKLEYRPQLREAADSIALRCASIFKDIRKHTGTDRGPRGQKVYEKVAWYFKRERVKPLRSSLESLKSTLNILLHIVQLAKSTKGVEEYPGVKSIGHWYVRKERRGLVYLIIDNRHAVENLQQLEQQQGQGNIELLENLQPLAFADVFPHSTASRKRRQSPERKFAVAFVNPSRRNDDDSQASQEPEIDFLVASPSTPRGDRFLLPSPSREDRSAPQSSTDSDVESIGRSTPSQSTPKSKTERRPNEEQATSRLILNVIPHEIVDEALKPAQNMSTLTLLEAKAEETIDLLMRHWTYVDPEYFSEDERSSIASTEPSLSMFRNRDDSHFHKGKSPDLAGRPSSPTEDSIRKGSNSVDNSDLTEDLFESQWVSMEANGEASSSSPAGHIEPAKKRSSPLSPTSQTTQGNRDARARRLSHEQSNRAVQSPKEPSTPAPPYSSGQPSQCPSCSAVSDTEPKTPTEKRPWRPTGGEIVDAETDEATSTSIDSAVKLLETRLLEMMKGNPLPNIKLDAQSHQVIEQKENPQHPIALEQDTDPVILKDCLGRKFLFPIQKCKSWQNMENLIKRSFSHVESMNSKIFRGSYDILSPSGEIILPEIWDSVIRPGWVVELRFWDFRTAEETDRKDPEAGVVEIAPMVQSIAAATRQICVEASPENQLTTAKRRASFRTWLGSRRLTPSVALE